MDAETTNLILIAVVVLGAAGAAAYYIARYLKGSITIALPRSSFNAGEAVEGSFELLARREISGNALTAALVASETTTERDFKGRSRRHTREIFRTGQTVEQARVYPAGYKGSYNFRITLPDGQFAAGGPMLGGTLGFLLGANRRVSWKVEVRLDAAGVDLASSEKIYVG